MIAGLETPTSGHIYFDDEEVTDTSPQERNIAMVFQNIALYPHMNVRQNIGYGLKVKGVPDQERNDRIEQAADILEISDELDKMPSELSGGQQQRVALGAAFVEDPEVILFDEPMSDLDAKLRAQLRVETQRLHQQMNSTMIYVTHNQTEALTMSDKIVLMDEGNIAQYGSPEKLYSSPDSEFVATFIGTPSTNIIHCGVHKTDDHAIIMGFEQDIPIPDNIFLEISDQINVGIRPQDMSLSEGNFELTVEVTVIEMLGDQYVIHGETENGTEIDIVTGTYEGVEPGDTISAWFDIDDIFLFDSSSGKRIKFEPGNEHGQQPI